MKTSTHITLNKEEVEALKTTACILRTLEKTVFEDNGGGKLYRTEDIINLYEVAQYGFRDKELPSNILDSYWDELQKVFTADYSE